jgi:hypothetical protein
MSTLVIEGGDRWRVEQREQERARMASYIARVDNVPGRCVDCAFREGSEASKSRLVLHLIEGVCLPDENNNFCCHHGEPDRPCVGFTALRESFASASAQTSEDRRTNENG